MSTKPSLPTGVSRFFFRLPIWLYHWRLGWLLGARFVLLNHVGRKSGQIRQAVVEVVRHDRSSDTYIICSGFGEKAQWFQNVMQTPDITIQIGRRHLAVTAERLPPTIGGDEMVDYARRHPSAARQLARFMGFQVDGSEAAYRTAGEQLPFVALHPR